MLSAANILAIHEVLVLDFADSSDPVSPSGVKSEHLLESAVSRQNTGFDERLKYDTAESNAATLCYGICCNHPFHNGNKRTALVATLCHLDRNDRTFHSNLTQNKLYDFMIDIAGHNLGAKGKHRDKSDEEVEIIARWLRRNTRRVEHGERVIMYRTLRSVLNTYGFELENPDNNAIDIVRYKDHSEWFGLRKRRERQRIIRIAWPRDGATVGKGILREVREVCELTEKHGVDSATFYAAERPIDYFIQRYKGTLRRLAKT
ncbi:type II toxin-antitoxin system death-on-curing family toxin [Ralstonia pseudosolanacearum]|nr:type II toxin-antitoxin system death-on-curing family toxin [Ralstonia pseudosolanacearum]QKL56835.1 type II toxin-antitoxin system death-on-curing family toxin [Ralstonia solanacearum]MCK4127119.1 type II toxin-antitoxin system death-on-curing family toxin [Ralstonia pseudosolanacearum]QKM32887.1 type II toxin-antitoxin system death-on-curing family toxin [Ralstonia solanacearum]QKM37873.1 type II toxin-antitoxin system death-on-curing family toxin [Ralstonia solanacearum]USS48220.1 type I